MTEVGKIKYELKISEEMIEVCQTRLQYNKMFGRCRDCLYYGNPKCNELAYNILENKEEWSLWLKQQLNIKY